MPVILAIRFKLNPAMLASHAESFSADSLSADRGTCELAALKIAIL